MANKKSTLQRFADLQIAVGVVNKDAVNPHFKNKYATLASIQEAVIGQAMEHGFVIRTSFDSESIKTDLVDIESSEVVNSASFPMTKDASAQSMGSYITYGKRYGITAVLNLRIDDDDDGNAGSKGVKGRRQEPVEKVNAQQAEVLKGLVSQLPPERFDKWHTTFGYESVKDVLAKDFDVRSKQLSKVLEELEAAK